MLIQPVIMELDHDPALTPRERVARQRQRAREALSRCARLCALPEGCWPQAAGGAPLPRAGWHWSISHKPRLVAAVIANRPVGVDVEQIRPRANRRLWDRLAGPREWDIAGDRTWEMFFRLWTAKEATLKANSRGIGGLEACRITAVPDDRHVEVDYGQRCWRIAQHFHHGHIAAVTMIGESVCWQAGGK